MSSIAIDCRCPGARAASAPVAFAASALSPVPLVHSLTPSSLPFTATCCSSGCDATPTTSMRPAWCAAAAAARAATAAPRAPRTRASSRWPHSCTTRSRSMTTRTAAAPRSAAAYMHSTRRSTSSSRSGRAYPCTRSAPPPQPRAPDATRKGRERRRTCRRRRVAAAAWARLRCRGGWRALECLWSPLSSVARPLPLPIRSPPHSQVGRFHSQPSLSDFTALPLPFTGGSLARRLRPLHLLPRRLAARPLDHRQLVWLTPP